MMVKILQGATVALFVIVVIIGLVVLFSAEGRMAQYKEFVGIIFPLFLTMVVPALIGSPLTDYMRARSRAIGNRPKDESPNPADGSGQGLVG